MQTHHAQNTTQVKAPVEKDSLDFIKRNMPENYAAEVTVAVTSRLTLGHTHPRPSRYLATYD
jgi:hypothetical protein